MTTDRKDRVLSLNARDDLLAIVDLWPRLVESLRPGGGGAQTGMPSGSSDAPLPIDVAVSDLMREIEDAARFWGHILMDETAWTPSTSAMPTLLEEVARRHGHFTADPQMALEFMDAAHDLRTRVAETLTRPEAPAYLGPCRAPDCPGELYVSVGKTSGRCRTCGTEFLLEQQRAWVGEQLAARLMTASEIGRALKVLGTPVPPATIRGWTIARRDAPPRLPGSQSMIGPETEEDSKARLYWLADAQVLVTLRAARLVELATARDERTAA